MTFSLTIDTGEIYSKEVLTKRLRELLKSGEMITRDNLAAINLGNNTKIKHVIHSSRSAKSLSQEANEVRGRSLFSINELIKNSVLVESVPNRKNKGDPNIIVYHRFYVPVAIKDGGFYTIRIVAEEKSGTKNIRPIEATLYDLILENHNPSPLPQHPSTNETKADLNN